MNRVAAFEALQRIKGNVAIAEWFLTNEDDDVTVALELLGRCNLVDSKIAEIRAEMAREPDEAPRAKATKRVPDSNVHVIGNRGDDAA